MSDLENIVSEISAPRAEGHPAPEHPQVTLGRRRWTSRVGSPRLVSLSWVGVVPVGGR